MKFRHLIIPIISLIIVGLAVYSVVQNEIKREIIFDVPENVSTTYVKTVDWPPQVELLKTELNCLNAGEETSRTGQTSSITINGRAYCLTKVVEGAAGSTYTQYAYSTQMTTGTLFIRFSDRRVQCGNYDYTEMAECEGEQKAFTYDSIINSIVESFRFTK